MKSSTTYSLGLDFGSDSVRALLVNTQTGEELATAVHYYKRWKEGQYCNPSENRFRQHPLDYIEGIEATVRSVVAQVGPEISAQIVSIGVDTTGSTPVAVDATGTPLALLEGFQENPNAMFVLWKDHTGIQEAQEINELCSKWDVDYSQYEGGIYSSEWFWSKILHVSRADAEVHKAAYSWVEHCDWVPFLLTGGDDVRQMKRSRCAAGHKALWHESYNGLPPNAFFVALDPLLDGLRERLFDKTYTSDVSVGNLSAAWAERLGLSENLTVSVGAFDAHMGAVGAKIEPYYLTKIMGTSTCDVLVAPVEGEEKLVKGICGQVDGSVIPQMLGLEAGQSAFGDIYAWYQRVLAWPIEELISKSGLIDEATKRKLIEEALGNLIPELSNAASKEPIGASGELALDWMNGRRTPDANQNLKGVIAGINLGSTSPKIFRALVEASCFGAKKIVDRFLSEGIPIKGVIALGGVAKKSPFIMQMMADVLNMPIKVVASEQACALGAAIFGAVAAEVYDTVPEAMERMGSAFEVVYEPNRANVGAYAEVYERYGRLCDTMEKHIMNQIKNNG
ncbi:ribulokinase [Zobellia galactanivorans]|uniref:Ribulokinase n=1 Tax=Zobellia galactanivorans (strain DSM 12802 / CCUG 47099 / CIP 106680 / NCIMB 13871 / Dsij) TaxID=63186 RepID=G0LBG4_ZOBGA|nr:MULTISPECIES: ribulokinase [Zobellia]MBU3026482.1 ribulokinase [Zobellia galactanivorans]MDO6809981.1 ribulokinase [Zobellia galactanivorans]OWW27032.1 ribulokinase [Zobellia sp. OII3]CAZ96084.1 Ribulokinase [Zobellia galactanivorans]